MQTNLLLAAAADNHTRWFASPPGSERRRYASGATAIFPFTTSGPPEAILTFPRLRRADASTVLDDFLDDCRARGPLRCVSCWSVDAGTPRDLGARLVARGFGWGWRPRWMALDLGKVHPTPIPDDVVIALEPHGSVLDVDDLPYYSREAAEAGREQPPRPGAWTFVARQNGVPVGHTTVFLADGRHAGCAGIYDVGVVPSARGQGIGAATVAAACRHAAALGARHATLNATGETMYRRVGFEPIGWGQTWWLHGTPPPLPAPERIAFAEAVGRGDIAALDTLRADGTLPEDLDAPLPPTDRMTPMALAIAAKRPASADWLSRHGATLDAIDAWDLGRPELARELLERRPGLVDQRRGADKLTPMHVAVLRDDLALARLLLAASPDLSLTDGLYNGTPLGWARHLGRIALAALLDG